MCFFRRKKKQKEAQKQQRILQEEELKKQAVERALADQQPAEVSKSVEEKIVQKPEPKAAAKPAAKKVVEKPAEEPAKATEDNVAKNPNPKYHVSQNKDEKSEHFKSWRVRKEGSQKTIKFFPTQLEAIEYAQDLADKAGTTIVIHKVDGSIRKQDYTKNKGL